MSETIKMRLKAMSSTPGKLRLALISIWACALVLFAVTYYGQSVHHEALTTVGRQAAPNVVNAQRIRALLAEMDAQAANELVGKPGENMRAAKAYDAKYKQLLDAISDASENLTFGEAERAEIRRLSGALASYHASITQAHEMQTRGDVALLAAYRRAATIMDKELLPAADALSKVNSDAIEKTYAEKKRASVFALVLFGAGGLALMAVLGATQLFLSRKMHRTLNPCLAGATGLTALFVLYSGGMLMHSSHQLSVAKKDPYPTVSTLWRARAQAFEVKGLESVWLLDGPQAAALAREFERKAASMKELPHAAEFANFLQVDAEIRRLSNAGQRAKAIALSIGKDPGEANHAFGVYDTAVEKSLDESARAFDDTVNSGLGDIRLLILMGVVVAVMVSVLAVFGLSPRLKEYQV